MKIIKQLIKPINNFDFFYKNLNHNQIHTILTYELLGTHTLINDIFNLEINTIESNEFEWVYTSDLFYLISTTH